MKFDLKYLLFSMFILLLIGCGGGTTTTEEVNESEQQNVNMDATIDTGTIASLNVAKPVAPTPVLATATESGSVTLSWQAPTENTDGSVLTDLAGYYIYYGKIDDYGEIASVGIDVIDIQDANTNTHTIAKVQKRNYFFAISAYTSAGIESIKVSAIPAMVN